MSVKKYWNNAFCIIHEFRTDMMSLHNVFICWIFSSARVLSLSSRFESNVSYKKGKKVTMLKAKNQWFFLPPGLFGDHYTRIRLKISIFASSSLMDPPSLNRSNFEPGTSSKISPKLHFYFLFLEQRAHGIFALLLNSMLWQEAVKMLMSDKFFDRLASIFTGVGSYYYFLFFRVLV